MRAAAALAVTAQFLTLAMLAEGSRNQYWRHAAVAMLTFGMMLFGWSWLTPCVNATWLNRSVILMLEAFGLTAVYALLLDKLKARFPEWTSSARTCVPWLLGAGVVALLFCLQTEIFYQLEFGAVLIHPASLVAIGVTLGAAVVTCVLFALSPNHDPLSLSERGAGEVCLRCRSHARTAVPAHPADNAMAIHGLHRTLLASGDHGDFILRCRCK